MNHQMKVGLLALAIAAAAALGYALGVWEASRGAPAATTPPTPAPATGEKVNLISPNYPPAVAGSKGWEYHKQLEADLNGDGKAEAVHVTTSAAWDSKTGQFMWDDGHPWHVYVQAPDGTLTYIYSRWVQIGDLQVMLTADKPGVLILERQGAGLAAYRVTYSGPGKHEAVQLLSVPTNGMASFTDPKFR